MVTSHYHIAVLLYSVNKLLEVNTRDVRVVLEKSVSWHMKSTIVYSQPLPLDIILCSF